jgi:hypothetical protein
MPDCLSEQGTESQRTEIKIFRFTQNDKEVDLNKFWTASFFYSSAFLLVFSVLLFIACTKPDGIPVGFSTTVQARPEQVLAPDEFPKDFFFAMLCIDSTIHFPGKGMILFDTIFSSTLKPKAYQYSNNFLSDSLNGPYLATKTTKNKQFHVLKEAHYYIYRGIIHEPQFMQYVVLDIAKRDSVQIMNYFSAGTLEKIIVD